MIHIHTLCSYPKHLFQVKIIEVTSGFTLGGHCGHKTVCSLPFHKYKCFHVCFNGILSAPSWTYQPGHNSRSRHTHSAAQQDAQQLIQRKQAINFPQEDKEELA